MNLRIVIIFLFGLMLVQANIQAQANEDTIHLNHIQTVGSKIMYNDADSAIKLFNTGITIAGGIISKSSDIPVKANAYKNWARFLGYLGTCYYFRGNYSEGLNFYFQSLELNKKMKYKWGIAGCYNNIGVVYDEMGDYEKALHYYFLALQLAAELQNKKMAANAFGNIGVIYYLQGNYPQALKYYFEAFKINYELKELKGMASALGNIGIVYHEQHEPEKAIGFHLKAYGINQLINNTKGMALNLGNMAIDYGELKLYDKSLECLHKALQLNTKLGLQSEIAFNYISLGTAYKQKKDHQLALNYFLKAFELSQELGNKYHLAYCSGQIGLLYLEKNELGLSKKYLEKAKELSMEINALALMQENFDALSQLSAKTGQFSDAYKYHLQYTALKDSIFNDDKSKEIGKLEAEHEMEIEKIEKERRAEEERLAKIRIRNRRNLVQYSGIFILLVIVALGVIILGFKKVSPQMATAATFFAFLLLFEFLLLLLDPYVDRFSKGEPAYKLFFNALIAACIFPIHALFERMLKKRLVRKS